VTLCKIHHCFPLLIPLVLGLLGLAGYSSCLLVTNGNASLEGEYEDDMVESLSGTIPFWFGVEPGLAWFVFLPIVSTLFFSGVLGCCGKLPLLGGRPRDKRMLEQGVRDTIIMPPETARRIRFWCCWDRRYGCFGSYPSASEQSEDEADTRNVVDIDIDIDIGSQEEEETPNNRLSTYPPNGIRSIGIWRMFDSSD
jgi:hypothetical protein